MNMKQVNVGTPTLSRLKHNVLKDPLFQASGVVFTRKAIISEHGDKSGVQINWVWLILDLCDPYIKMTMYIHSVIHPDKDNNMLEST